MPNPHVYLDVEWSNGDYLTEAKLDQMQENNDYVRYEAAFNTVLTYPDERVGSSAAGNIRLEIEINGVSLGNSGSYTSSTSYVWRTVTNVDISSESEGLNQLSVVAADSSSAKAAATCQFYRGLDAAYISAWAYIKLTAGTPAYASLLQVTAITHRLNEATW